MQDKKPDWTPILKNGAMLKLAQCFRKCLSHVSKEQKLTVPQAIQVLKTYVEWLEANASQSSLRDGPRELPLG